MVINTNFVHSKGQSRPALRPAGASASTASRGGTDAMQRQSILEMRRNLNIMNADLACATGALAAANAAIDSMRSELSACKAENEILKARIAELGRGDYMPDLASAPHAEQDMKSGLHDDTAESSVADGGHVQGGRKKNRRNKRYW